MKTMHISHVLQNLLRSQYHLHVFQLRILPHAKALQTVQWITLSISRLIMHLQICLQQLKIMLLIAQKMSWWSQMTLPNVHILYTKFQLAQHLQWIFQHQLGPVIQISTCYLRLLQATMMHYLNIPMRKNSNFAHQLKTIKKLCNSNVEHIFHCHHLLHIH